MDTKDIKSLSDEIIKSLPFLLDSKVNEAASVVIYNNMESCLKLSKDVNDMNTVGRAFQECVSYARKYNIVGLMNACVRWDKIATEKLDSFKREENSVSEESQDISIVEIQDLSVTDSKDSNLESSVYRELSSLESIINDSENSDKEVLMNAKEQLNNLEDRVRSSKLDPSVIKSVRYRIAILRESLNVSLVIIADMSSVRRLLNNARR